jgi:hypothetical protein
MAIADAGHSLTQVSHPVHLSLSTIATNSFTPRICFGEDKKRVSIISSGLQDSDKTGRYNTLILDNHGAVDIGTEFLGTRARDANSC